MDQLAELSKTVVSRAVDSVVEPIAEEGVRLAGEGVRMAGKGVRMAGESVRIAGEGVKWAEGTLGSLRKALRHKRELAEKKGEHKDPEPKDPDKKDDDKG